MSTYRYRSPDGEINIAANNLTAVTATISFLTLATANITTANITTANIITTNTTNLVVTNTAQLQSGLIARKSTTTKDYPLLAYQANLLNSESTSQLIGVAGSFAS
jgi:hypothetical protein